jgi:hypothetical protein
MSQTQKCHVCGDAGLLVEGRVYVTGEAAAGPALIARCPRCKRFICSRHGEKLDLSTPEKRPLFSFGGKKAPASLTVCCPFDPGVPLGDPE